MLTEQILSQICTKNKNVGELLIALINVLDKYDINTNKRIAGFLAQCGHESADFTVLKENLNYGAAGLRGTFGKYFKDDATAKAYERQPEKNYTIVNKPE